MTKEIKLTKGMKALVDDEDYEWLSQRKWFVHSNNGKLYAFTTRKQKFISMHREILDAPEGVKVDHKDGNGLNNQRGNIRLCTQMENTRNRRIGKDNSSGYKGVCWNKKVGKYCAKITVNKREVFLGYFYDPAEGGRAYDKAAEKYFGEFANLNFKKGEQNETGRIRKDCTNV